MDMTQLTWQGAAGRRPDDFVLVRVENIEPERRGLFGVLNAPSIATSMPNGQLLRAIALPPRQEKVRLRIPAGELPSLQRGDLAVLGVVEGSACLCVLKPPAEIAVEGIAGWAETQPCGR